MRERGKTEYEGYEDQNMCGFPCTKHPYSGSSSSTTSGICAYCLTDRLYQLVCPQCGEQRLSSCSCSSNDNNAASVGRISSLLENDKQSNNNAAEISCSRPSRTDNVSVFGGNNRQQYQQRYQQQEDVAVAAPPLRRSNSTCVDMSRARDQSRSGGAFSKLGKLFRKKKDKKSCSNSNNREEMNDESSKSEMGMSECVGRVSRSRSMCSFRGFNDTEESGVFHISSSAARASNVSANNYMMDSAKVSCFSESEARISNFDYDPSFVVGPNRSIYPFKEGDFSCGDDPAFIDLKLNDMSLDSRSELPLPPLRRGGFGMSSTREFGYNNRGGEFMSNANSYGGRYSNVSEKELRKCKKNSKVWKWFSSRRKDEDHHGFN